MGDTAAEYGRRRFERERVLRLRDEDGQRGLREVTAAAAEVLRDEVKVFPLGRRLALGS